MLGWSPSTSESGMTLLAGRTCDVRLLLQFRRVLLEPEHALWWGEGFRSWSIRWVHAEIKRCIAAGLTAETTGGPEGLRGLCSMKAVTEDRFFKWIRTSIPVPVGKLRLSTEYACIDRYSVVLRLSSSGS